MLRSLPRAAHTSPASLLPSSSPLTRRTLKPFLSAPAACLHAHRTPSTQQTRSAHAISNPTLAGIEKRWEAMPPQEQAELWMALRDRMKADWNELTMQEKKAGMLLCSALLCERMWGVMFLACYLLPGMESGVEGSDCCHCCCCCCCCYISRLSARTSVAYTERADRQTDRRIC